MTNEQWLKSLSTEELVREMQKFERVMCNFCANKSKECTYDNCESGIEKWLQAEREEQLLDIERCPLKCNGCDRIVRVMKQPNSKKYKLDCNSSCYVSDDIFCFFDQRFLFDTKAEAVETWNKAVRGND